MKAPICWAGHEDKVVGHNALISALLASINSRPGGIGGLIDKFHAVRAGHVVDSWISTGANLPVSSDTLKKVFGRGELHALTGQPGVAPERATGILAQSCRT